MAEPITLKGIQRNASKLAVEDGRAEDLINLRFKDGSWRTSGDGKMVYKVNFEYTYTQLYIHTNIYRHLLGVRDGKLWWFADIDNNGVFINKPNPSPICDVSGDLYITQNGHLLTIIDHGGTGYFGYAIFKTIENEYAVIQHDTNGANDDRELYPFGEVHCNLNIPDDENHTFIKKTKQIDKSGDYKGILLSTAHADMLEMFNKATENNKFTSPFLMIIACTLYDGSTAFASNPIFMNPLEKCSMSYSFAREQYRTLVNGGNMRFEYLVGSDIEDAIDDSSHVAYIYQGLSLPYFEEKQTATSGLSGGDVQDFCFDYAQDDKRYLVVIKSQTQGTEGKVIPMKKLARPIMSSGSSAISSGQLGKFTDYYTVVNGADIILSLGDMSKIDKSIIKSVSIYITKPSSIYDLSADGYKKSPFYVNEQSEVYLNGHVISTRNFSSSTVETVSMSCNGFCYFPRRRTTAEIMYNLVHSPFYLLREYATEELQEFIDNPVIDLSSLEYKGVLANITQQRKLDYESQSRTTYLPKVSYMYNGKLHIANYIAHEFHGYSADLFHLHNHSLQYQAGATFKRILNNLAAHNDEYVQFPKTDYRLTTNTHFVENDIPALIVRIKIDTEQGDKYVVRHIKAQSDYGAYDFIESLNPLLSYPDARASKMEIWYATGYDSTRQKYDFDYFWAPLKPSPYINIAFYIDNLLKPIDLAGNGTMYSYTKDEVIALLQETNTEDFPNGLKVSKVDNPLYFPVEQAYQIGSSEIISLCSNAIAIGTGQTGAAPLYVFCTDGIYALYVDASGEIAYTNARIIARDVCNNAKSVTPIDTGVVFTTDRGLMEIAGDVVNEIGQPAEGDVVDYTEPDWAKPRNVGKNILTNVANLQLNLVDGVDFLSYLRGAIINYNHNERELMVSNPDYPYSYVLDRYSNWSRRDYSADEYVNNYPTSYRVKDGVFYKVDAEQDGLEGKSEAPNDFLYLSNVIKLGSVDFKKAYRFVVRGQFETTTKEVIAGQDTYLVENVADENYGTLATIDGLTSTHTYRLSIRCAARQHYNTIVHIMDEEGAVISTHNIPDDSENHEISLSQLPRTIVLRAWNNTGDTMAYEGSYVLYDTTESVINNYVGCYVFGSYDGKKFALLGGSEKHGQFTDIGCKVERTDVKYFRVALASGGLTGNSRIDFMEIEDEQSNMTTKLR